MKTESTGLQVSMVFLEVCDKGGSQWFVHRRAKEKKVYPGLWGIGAGGKADPGESPEMAAQRELLEELAVDAVPHIAQGTGLWKPVVSFDWNGDGLRYRGHVYHLLLQTIPPITPSTREFDQWHWCCTAEVEQMLRDKILCPDTALAWTKFQLRTRASTR